MKKMFVFGIVVGAILALGAMAFSVYDATSANAANPQSNGLFTPGFGKGNGPMFHGMNPNEQGPDNGMHGNGMHGDGPLHPYVEEAVAGILGLSIEDLQTARQDGTKMSELLETAGLTAEEFHTALEAATPGIVEKALADEAITQEQADLILEHGLPMFGKHNGPGGPGGPDGLGLEGDGVLQPYLEAAVAEALDMSVEDLQAAKEARTRLPELLETAGLTPEEFQTAMEKALPGLVEQALKDGMITQTQADDILKHGLRGAKGYLHKALQVYMDAAMADTLGVDVEALQTARENHTLHELIEAAGLTREDMQTALEEATPSIVELALKDGAITQAQADFLLEHGLRGFGERGPGGPGDCMGGPGKHGPHGGDPGGFGPDNQPPATDTSSADG